MTSLTIKGFRSFESVEALPLGELNILVGANGSGKSNFIDFFRMLRFAMNNALQEFVQTNGFAESLLHHGSKETPTIQGRIGLRETSNEQSMNLDYGFQLGAVAPDNLVFLREELSLCRDGGPAYFEDYSLGGRESSLLSLKAAEPSWMRTGATWLRRVLGGLRIYQFHDTSPSSRLRKAADANADPELSGDGGNLAAMLFRMASDAPAYFDRLVKTVRRMVPGFHEFVLKPEGRDASKFLLRWRGRNPEYVFGPHQISDGSLRFMALATLLMQPPEQLPDIIIIDEPELGLHPAAEAVIAGLMQSASLHCQVIAATQSASFLDSFEPENVIVAEAREAFTHLRRVDSEAYQEWLADYTLGEVWRKNLIGGRP